MVYSKTRPAKRKRATLESDPPRDTRMGGDGCPSGRGVRLPCHTTTLLGQPELSPNAL